MSTQTAESTTSITSLKGILETPFFQGIVPITQEEEERIQQKIKEKLSNDSPEKGEVLGDLLPFEKAVFIRSKLIRMEAEKEEEKLGHPLFVLLSGDQRKIEALEKVGSKKEKADLLRGIFWSLVKDRFLTALADGKVTELLVNYQFQVVAVAGPCPGCGEYHG